MIENYNDRGYGQQTITLTDSVSKVMRGVYLRMFLGLILTAVTAFLAASSKEFMITLISNRLLFWGLMIAELAVVLVFSARINKMSTGMAALLFSAMRCSTDWCFPRFSWRLTLARLPKRSLLQPACSAQ